MIRFCCEQCGSRLGVPDESAGGRGKCPKCGNVINVPDKTATIELHCGKCGRKIAVSKIHAGKKGRCPHCKNLIDVPKAKEPVYVQKQDDPADTSTRLVGNDIGLALLEVPEELKHRNGPIEESGGAQEAIEQESKEEPEVKEAELACQRNFPWFIDIFVYPIGVSSMIHLIILSFLPRKLLPLFHSSYWLQTPIFGLGFIVIFIGYFLYCLSGYICDSASGNRRAPEIEVSISVLFDIWEIISPILLMFGCMVVCVGPLFIYFIVTERTDLIFLLFALYGVFFLPMVLMATVLFDSLRALNPILIIVSILNTFIPYCCLVVLFCGFVGIIAMIIALLPRSWIIGYILSAACVYLAMVISHLLGRFYYKYQDRLNWEV